MPREAEALDRSAVLDLALERVASFAGNPNELERFLARYVPNDADAQRVIRRAVETTLELRKGLRRA